MICTKPLNFAVFLGSTRPGREAPRISELVAQRLEQLGHKVTLLDPVEFPSLETFHKPIHHYKEGEEVPAELAAWASRLKAVDGFAIVACEYNHAPSPALLAVLDHFYEQQYLFKASAIFTYSWGYAGGGRSAFVLRNVLGQLGLITCPTIVSLPLGDLYHRESQDIKEKWSVLIDKAINELVWYTASLKTSRETTGLPY